MSAAPQPTVRPVRSIPVRTASGAIVDVMIRPGAADTAQEFAALVEILRESLSPGMEIVEECAP